MEAMRGCVYMGSRELAVRWQWSRGKVLRFLSDLEREQKIVPQTGPQNRNVISCISITNYDKYQYCDTTNDTTNGTTNQEKKKEPKKNKNIRTQDILSPLNPPMGKGELDWTVLPSDYVPIVEEWVSYKKEKSQSYKPTGFRTLCKKLIELSNGNAMVARAIIEQSMQNNWAGIFPLKSNTYGREQSDSAKAGSRLAKLGDILAG